MRPGQLPLGLRPTIARDLQNAADGDRDEADNDQFDGPTHEQAEYRDKDPQDGQGRNRDACRHRTIPPSDAQAGVEAEDTSGVNAC